MIVPSRPILAAAGAIALLLLAAPLAPQLALAALVADALLVALVLADGRRLRSRQVVVEREGWARLQLGRPTELVYRIENRSPAPLIVAVRQPWPETLEAPLDRLELRVEPGEIVRAALSVTPRRRGQVRVVPTEVDIRHPAGLARRRWAIPGEAKLSVFPNLKGVQEYDALRRAHALRQVGIHRMRMIGAGREFDQLREYQPDDNYGDINWKATASRRSPITNIFQAERSQEVMICLDCGRMMGNPVGAGTMLDLAVDASIMLAHVANRYSDRVGLLLFRDTVTRFLKPAAGPVAVQRIVGELVDAQPEGVFPSYAEMVSSLRRGQKRRSIVFIFTDLNDPQLAADLAQVLPLTSRRHVVVVVSLRDPLLTNVARGPASSRRELFQVLAASELDRERAARSAELVKAGVSVLEVEADSISLDVVNRYLAIKMRQLV